MITSDPFFVQGPVATSILDPMGQRVARNAAYRSLLHPDGDMSQPWDGPDAPTPSTAALAALADGDLPSIVETHETTSGLGTVRLRSTVVPIAADDGSVTCFAQSIVPIDTSDDGADLLLQVYDGLTEALTAAEVLGRAVRTAANEHVVDDLLTSLHGARKLIADRVGDPDVLGGSDGPPRILVIEDSVVNQVLFRSQLDQLGYDHDLAKDGLTGFELATTRSYDGVLLDWHLPDIEGPEVAKRIRASETGDRVPIIAVTARAMVGDRQACLDAGMDDFLNKPVSITDLSDTLLRWTNTGSSSAPDADAESSVDSSVLADLSAQLGDPMMVGQVIETYLDELPGRQQALDDALADDAPDEIRRIAHTLKSTSAMLGATALATHCQRTESAAAEADSDLAPLVAELQRLAEHASVDLSEKLADLRRQHAVTS